MRFKKYVCPKADQSPFNVASKSGDCMYKGFLDRESNICTNCGIDYEAAKTIWNKIDDLLLNIPYWLRRPFRHPIKDVKRQWRYFWQRRFRGFDDSELWSLDYTCAKLMAPRLRAFIDTYGARSVPAGLNVSIIEPSPDSQAEWRAILEKMQRAFQLIIDEDGAIYMYEEKERQEIEDGLDLFRKWYHHLWD